MKIVTQDPVRGFTVKGVTLSHTADITLEPDELVTFKNDNDASELDVTAKEWGFYATPSVNGRLRNFNFRTALAKNTETGLRYVLLVKEGKEQEFHAYLAEQGMTVLGWLDEDHLEIVDK